MRLKAKESAERIGSCLRAARMESGLTLKDVAKRLGVQPQTVSDVEQAKTANPTLGTLYRVARVLGLELVVEVRPALD